MARLNLPKEFFKQQNLLAAIKARHDADGASSPLNAYLALHTINLADDALAGNAAAEQELLRLQLEKDSEACTEKRNLGFNPVFAHLRGCFAFLKNFYGDEKKQIAEWGAPVTTSGKIRYPAGFLARTELFAMLKTKSDSISPPDANPLLPYLAQNNIVLADDETAVAAALENHTKAGDFARRAENAREKRDLLWLPVLQHIRNIGQLLMKLYNTNPKQLGEYGYTVAESPKPHRLRKTTVKLSGKKTSNGIIIGGELTNTGPVDLLIYKGRSIAGDAITMAPGEVIKIPKGYSIITVLNPSLTKNGIFSVLVSR